MKKQQNMILTCSLCSNFDPIRTTCKLNNEKREAISDKYATQCKKEGKFLRYLNVLPDAYNYFTEDEPIPDDFSVDLSKLPKDDNGVPLFVSTNRGIERAIPADNSVKLKSHMAFGVESIYTYQGQREVIYDLGIEKARREAEKAGVRLTVLSDEIENREKEGPKGEEKCIWLNDEPNEGWD